MLIMSFVGDTDAVLQGILEMMDGIASERWKSSK